MNEAGSDSPRNVPKATRVIWSALANSFSRSWRTEIFMSVLFGVGVVEAVSMTVV
jgi:hypothetical protein